MQELLEAVDAFECTVHVVGLVCLEAKDTLGKRYEFSRSRLCGKAHPRRVDHRYHRPVRDVVVGGQRMFDHVHRGCEGRADLHPSVEGDHRGPLHLGTRFDVATVGHRLGPPLHCGEDDSLGETVLDWCAIDAVEVALGNVGYQVADTKCGLILRHAHGQLGIHQGDTRVKAVGDNK